MKRELRPAIHMEKQLSSASKLVEMETLGLSKVDQIGLASLMESQICHQLAGSVGGRV